MAASTPARAGFALPGATPPSEQADRSVDVAPGFGLLPHPQVGRSCHGICRGSRLVGPGNRVQLPRPLLNFRRYTIGGSDCES